MSEAPWPNMPRPSSTVAPTPARVAFPSELVDAIIDQIHLDLVYVDSDQYKVDEQSRKRALDAYSLVSKSGLLRVLSFTKESSLIRGIC
jgi:hypothetical protein